jgi:hypothetical protein
MVTSNAYRMDSSAPDVADRNRAIDPDNNLLWRMNVRRMEAEALRDSLLAIAGELDETMGGPELDHAAGMATQRRSLYYRHAQEKQMQFLTLFDAASVNECYQRTESIVPQQALALANSSLSISIARRLATTLAQETSVASREGANRAFVDRAFVRVLCRPPSNDERRECLAFLDRQAALLADPAKLAAFGGGLAIEPKAASDPAQRARENLVHVLLNHHDFISVR